jgi:glutamate synthase domain-containing protein 2
VTDPVLRESATFDRATIAGIQRAARTGVYDIRGWGAKRRLPHFDDLLFLGASMSRYPLEGYRERCDTDVVLGDRNARYPLHLDIPVTIAVEHVGIPTLAAIPQAVQALAELGLHRKVQLIVSGGIRTGADVAKAMALGADAVAIGTARSRGAASPMW